MKKKSIIIIGGGGHAKSCIDLIYSTDKFKIKGILDIKEKVGETVLGIPIIDTDEDLERFKKKCDGFVIGVGQIKSPLTRIDIYERLKLIHAETPSIIAPSAYISPTAKIGDGSVIFHNVIVNVEAVIGNNCILNNNALIEHECSVGNYCHVSTGAALNGNVTVGEGSFIGSNATIKQGVHIGKFSIVGAGSVVIRDIGDKEIFGGVPAKRLKTIE